MQEFITGNLRCRKRFLNKIQNTLIIEKIGKFDFTKLRTFFLNRHLKANEKTIYNLGGDIYNMHSLKWISIRNIK